MIAAARRRLTPRAIDATRGGFPTQNNKAPHQTCHANTFPTAERLTEGKSAASFSSLSSTDKKQPITVCAMNNHPDYRLKLARERIQNTTKSSSPSRSSPSPNSAAMTFMKPPEPRKSDGSSSGSTTERRLWEARQKMLSKMETSVQISSVIQKVKNESKITVAPSTSMSSSVLPEPRKSDGSSSGAVTERRLREKRQAILDSMASATQVSSVQQNTGGTNPISSASIASRALPQPRKNDESSSGAMTEKRLREKRQAILDSMASATPISSDQPHASKNNTNPSASIASRALPQPRKNDGSSSGAMAEKRLRDKRQAILDSMASPLKVSSKGQNESRSYTIPSASKTFGSLPQPRKNDGSSSGALTEKRLRERRQAMLDTMAGK